MAKVKAVTRVKHDGEVYEPGAVFEVNDVQAKELKDAGAVKVGKDYKAPAEPAAADTTDEGQDGNDGTPSGTKTPDELAQG